MNTPMTSIKVQFYLYKNVHWPMFEQLAQYLKSCSDVSEIWICIPKYFQVNNQLAACPWLDELLDGSYKISIHPQEAQADITFIADSFGGKLDRCGKVVSVGHGTISKGYYFTDSIWVARENLVDMICVPGPYAQQKLAPILKSQVVATGMPKLDPVFNQQFNRLDYLAPLGIGANDQTILLAPTFNTHLSLLNYIGDQIQQVIQSASQHLIIKLHGSTPEPTKNKLRQMSMHPQVHYIDTPDLSPWLALCDVCISDVSSSMMEFMAQDKPVVLFNSPDWDKYHGYNPEEIEYQWRDMGIQVHNIEETIEAVQTYLRNPELHSAQRKYYGSQLFGETRGQSVEKTWQASLNLLSQPKRPQLRPLHSVIIPILPGQEYVDGRISALELASSSSIELILVSAMPLPQEVIKQAQELSFTEVKLINPSFSSSNLDAQTLSWKLFQSGVLNAQGEYIHYVDPWSQVFRAHFYFLDQIVQKSGQGLYVPVSTLSNSLNYYQKYSDLPSGDRDKEMDQIAYKLNWRHGFEVIERSAHEFLQGYDYLDKSMTLPSFYTLTPQLKSQVQTHPTLPHFIQGLSKVFVTPGILFHRLESQLTAKVEVFISQYSESQQLSNPSVLKEVMQVTNSPIWNLQKINSQGVFSPEERIHIFMQAHFFLWTQFPSMLQKNVHWFEKFPQQLNVYQVISSQISKLLKLRDNSQSWESHFASQIKKLRQMN